MNAITRTSFASLALLSCALFVGCGSEPTIEYRYDAYDGDAFPDRREPVAIPQGGLGIVTNSFSDTLSLLDLGTGKTLRDVPVGRDPVALDGPHHVAVDPVGGFVYIGLSYPTQATGGPHSSHGSSFASGYVQKISLSDFSILGQARVDANPGEIVASEDGKRVVLSHFDLQRAIQNPGNLEKSRATIALVDPAVVLPTGSTDPVRITTCIAPHGMALSRPDGARAYVACYGEDVVAIVDLEQRKVLSRVPMDKDLGPSVGDPKIGPYSAVLSADGKWLALGNTVSKDVRLLDVDAEAVDETRTIKTLGAPFFPVFSADGKRLWVPTQSPDALLVVDLENGNAVLNQRSFTASECKWPHVVERLDDTRITLVCEGDHTAPGNVLILDGATLETKGEMPVGVYPDGIAKVFPTMK